MRTGSPWFKTWLIAIVLASLCVTSGAASRSAARVRLGEVSVKGANQQRHMRELRRTLQKELRKIDRGKASSRERYILSAKLVKMYSQDSSTKATSTAVVSATLRRAGGGDLFALLRGRGRAEDAPGEVKSAQSLALQAAVRGALRGVPKAIR